MNSRSFHSLDSLSECQQFASTRRAIQRCDCLNERLQQDDESCAPVEGRPLFSQAISTRIRFSIFPVLRGPAGPAAGVRACPLANNSGLTCVFLLLDPRPAGNPGSPHFPHSALRASARSGLRAGGRAGRMNTVAPGCAAHGPLAAQKPRLAEGRAFALRRDSVIPSRSSRPDSRFTGRGWPAKLIASVVSTLQKTWE